MFHVEQPIVYLKSPNPPTDLLSSREAPRSPRNRSNAPNHTNHQFPGGTKFQSPLNRSTPGVRSFTGNPPSPTADPRNAAKPARTRTCVADPNHQKCSPSRTTTTQATHPTEILSHPPKEQYGRPKCLHRKSHYPSAAELAAALGPTQILWTEILGSLAKEHGITDQEWNSSKPKYGWTLLLKLKKRRIVYLGPCAGCFRASFILGDKAVAAARTEQSPQTHPEAARRSSALPGRHRPAPDQSKPHKDLPAIRKLAQIKLAN